MGTARHSIGETVLRLVLLLVLVLPLTLIGVRMLVDLVRHGNVRTILLLFVAMAVCVYFKSAIGRLVALIFVFCILPSLIGELIRGTNSFGVLVGLAALSVAAYVIRAHRLVHKEHVIKTHGAERTPVMPPGAEQ